MSLHLMRSSASSFHPFHAFFPCSFVSAYGLSAIHCLWRLLMEPGEIYGLNWFIPTILYPQPPTDVTKMDTCVFFYQSILSANIVSFLYTFFSNWIENLNLSVINCCMYFFNEKCYKELNLTKINCAKKKLKQTTKSKTVLIFFVFNYASYLAVLYTLKQAEICIEWWR